MPANPRFQAAIEKAALAKNTRDKRYSHQRRLKRVALEQAHGVLLEQAGTMAKVRFLLVEAAQAAARVHPDWRRRYSHLAIRRHKSIAKVAMGRRLAIRLYWMWRNGCEYSPSFEFGSYAGQPGLRHGVK